MLKFLPAFIFSIFLALCCLFIAPEVSAAACANVPLSDNYEVASNCVFNGEVNGVEQGNLTIKAGYTLTINNGQVIAFNPGQRVILEPGSSIALNTGGRLSVSYIWLKDQDEDRYPAKTATSSRDTPSGEGWQKRDYFKAAWATTNKSVWSYVEDIKYDYNDDPNAGGASIYPGTGCGEGRLCDVNSDVGTCVAKSAACLTTCERCDGTNQNKVNISVGKVCNNGSEVDVTSSYKCSGPHYACQNVCRREVSYRGCAGTGGTSCEATKRAVTTPSCSNYYYCSNGTCYSGYCSTPDPWSSCGSCSYATCARYGSGTRSRTVYWCVSASCNAYTESGSCTCDQGSQDGVSCGTPDPWSSCGSCSYSSTCAQYGSGTQSRKVYICSGGSCTTGSESQSCACDRGSRVGLQCATCKTCHSNETCTVNMTTICGAGTYGCSAYVCSCAWCSREEFQCSVGTCIKCPGCIPSQAVHCGAECPM